jgi:hypothetical protein
MKKPKSPLKIKLNGETIKALSTADLAQAAGASYISGLIRCPI